MKFSNEIYEKVFPRVEKPEIIESAVSSFTPTIDKVEESETIEQLELDLEGSE